ncbi:unnamed protein product [Protopolystoma xenopodis]|uniref:Uncharacterized protein n=1 Tax=Protopolystoma xenopodis TaxID=117903 RepID=A0A3S5ACQ4_9PLAT|nr:unnamed protein product [Protopolystoma xenopodis]
MYHLVQGMRQYFMPEESSSPMLPNTFAYSSQLDPLMLLALYVMPNTYLKQAYLLPTLFEYQVSGFGWRVRPLFG